MKKIVVVLCLLLCSGFALCQQTPKPATPEEIQKLVEVLRVRSQVETLQATMAEQAKNGARNAFLQQVPNATPELLAKVESMIGETFGEVISTDEIVTIVVPIYQKYFTHEDVEALLAFYSSPAGKHFLEISPKMMQEAGIAAGSLVQQRMGVIQAKMEARMQEIVDYVKAHPEAVGNKDVSQQNKDEKK